VLVLYIRKKLLINNIVAQRCLSLNQRLCPAEIPATTYLALRHAFAAVRTLHLLQWITI